MEDANRRIVKKLKSSSHKKRAKKSVPPEYRHLLLVHELKAKQQTTELLQKMVTMHSQTDVNTLQVAQKEQPQKLVENQNQTQINSFIEDTEDFMDKSMEYFDTLQMPQEALDEFSYREDLTHRVASRIKNVCDILQDACLQINIPHEPLRKEEYIPSQVSRATLYQQKEEETKQDQYASLPLWRRILRQSIMLRCETDDILFGSKE